MFWTRGFISLVLNLMWMPIQLNTWRMFGIQGVMDFGLEFN